MTQGLWLAGLRPGTPWAVRPCRWICLPTRRQREPPELSRLELVDPSLQEAALGLLQGQLQCFQIGLFCFRGAAKATAEIGVGGVGEVVILQFAFSQKLFDVRKARG